MPFSPWFFSSANGREEDFIPFTSDQKAMSEASSDSVQRSREFVDRLKRSRIFKDYEAAFRDTTGLPINLRPLEAFDLPHHGDPNENPFCALMAKTNQSCAACLQLQRKVEEEARMEPKTLK
jgi:hypothetical protein